MTTTASTQTNESDGFTLHRCTCRSHTVLGSYGFDSHGRYVYKVMWRERIMIMYFGAFALSCRDCHRWTRVRMLPKEKKAEITPMSSRPDDV